MPQSDYLILILGADIARARKRFYIYFKGFQTKKKTDLKFKVSC